MKHFIINKLIPGTVVAGLLVITTAGSVTSNSKTLKQGYDQGYQDAIKCYQQWLLDVDYAEYNRKTGEWQLVDASTIQGNLIEPQRRPLFVNVEDHIQALEHELQVARKQNAANKSRTKTQLDVKRIP